MSLSARRAWIEISEDWLDAGCLPVALRKESVDRNAFWTAPSRPLKVALRKESVDRNVDPDKDSLTDDVSLSARRAWIEIDMGIISTF